MIKYHSVAEAFTNIAESTAKVKVGTNAILIDNIGEAFTVVVIMKLKEMKLVQFLKKQLT